MAQQNVSISDLSFGFNSNREDLILKGFSLTVDHGEQVAIVGPSGSGKTTLLRIIAGVLTASSGELRVFQSAYLSPERPALLSFRTTTENALLAKELRGNTTAKDLAIASELLHDLGLARANQKRPDELSFGMRQRLGLAQSLMTGSKLLLFDEPFSGLDVLTRRTAETAVDDFCTENNLSYLMVTHDLGTAVAMANKILVMSGAPWHVMRVIEVDQQFNSDVRSPVQRRNSKNFDSSVMDVQRQLNQITTHAI